MQSAPMLRLLQGDVGSGKTVVALIHADRGGGGGTGGLAGPTEILARQHFATLQRMLTPRVSTSPC
jgi:ATP-dependent DNA helicase RecG